MQTALHATERPKLQNIAVPDPLHRKLKAKAADQGCSIRELVTPVLEDIVKDEPAQASEGAQ